MLLAYVLWFIIRRAICLNRCTWRTLTRQAVCWFHSLMQTRTSFMLLARYFACSKCVTYVTGGECRRRNLKLVETVFLHFLSMKLSAVTAVQLTHLVLLLAVFYLDHRPSTSICLSNVHPQKVFPISIWFGVWVDLNRTYAPVWLRPNPRSRSWSLSFWSSENCTFLSLSSPPFWHRWSWVPV